MGMNKTIVISLAPLTLVAGLLLGAAGPAEAKAAPHCKVLSVQTVTQSRDVNGMVVGIVNGHPVFGHGIQHRVQTSTTERCRGKVSTTVTYTSWS